MAQRATVVDIKGSAVAVSATGEVRQLAVGSVLSAGEQIRTAPDARVVLTLEGGEQIVLPAGTEVAVQALVPEGAQATAVVPAEGAEVPAESDVLGAQAADVQAVIQALEQGADLTQELEAAAAGAGAGGGGDGSSFVRLLRITEGVSPLAYDYSFEPLDEIRDIEGGAQSVIPNLTLTATPAVDEGSSGIVYLVTLDTPALTEMRVVLSNGATVVVPAGATSGSVLAPVQGDDPYIDGETLSVTVSDVQGGGYPSVAVNDAGAVTVVSDTPTPTYVVLSVADVNEDDASTTFAVTLTHPAQTDVTVVTNLGTVLIPAGESTGMLVVDTADPDVYRDPTSITASVTGVTGGNFELVDFGGASATAQITDTLDTTQVSISAGAVTEDEPSVTFTVTLSSPGQTDVTVFTSLGNVLIPAGQSQGQLVVNTADPDVYKDPDSVSAVVTGLEGGNFEAVDFSQAQTSAAITDTIDTTTVSMSAEGATEDQLAVRFTVTLSNAGQTDVTITTNLGDVLIPAGQTTGVLEVETQDPDVYVDPTHVSAFVTGVVGGNFEAVNYGSAAATAQVIDTINPTTVTLAGMDVTEDMPSASFSVTLSNPGESDVTVITNLGNVLILAGETEGTLVVNTANPDVYVDPGQVTVTVQGVVGGNFESVEYEAASATVLIKDTIDTTPIVLSGTQAFEGGLATLGATVPAPVTGSDLLISLDNGATIRIPVGERSGVSTVFAVANADDPYVDAGRYEVGIVSVSGGNYEALGTDSRAEVVFADTIDPTAVTLSDVTAFEGGLATVSASVVNPVTGSDLLITLSNGATIVIPEGESSGVSSVFQVANAEDPYVDAGQYELGIASVSGGNYESLTLTDTATVSFLDTPTPTQVLVTTADVPETATEVVFEIQLSNVPESAAVAQVLVDGVTHEVALDAEGHGRLVIPFSDNDVYVDADSITATVTGVIGGQYEQVDLSQSSATAHIYDVVDVTPFTLSGPASLPEGAPSITYTVELGAPVKGSPLEVVLSNGATLTIGLDQNSGSVTVPLPAGVLSLAPVSIASHSGGNYEGFAYVNTVITDIDSQPSGPDVALSLIEGQAVSGSAAVVFDTGADAMDPQSFSFASPLEVTPVVSGLSDTSLQWTLLNPGVLQAQTSQGTLVLTLSGASAQGVYVTATLDGNLLHTDDVVSVSNVVIQGADTDGDAALARVSVDVSDVEPWVAFTSVVGSAAEPGDVYSGLWSANMGVDDTTPTVNSVVLTGASIDGEPATGSMDFDPSTRTGSGTLSGSGFNIPFTFALQDNGAYTLDLEDATRQVTITADDYKGDTRAEGPTPIYTITYLDPDTGATGSAQASPLTTGTVLNLVGLGADAQSKVSYQAYAVGESINASSDGIGIDSNVLESYLPTHQQPVYSTEALRYDPEGQVSAVTLDFTGGGANQFGGGKTDVLYIALTGLAGTQTVTQTIMLDSRYGDFIVNGDSLVPMTSTAYAGGALPSYSVALPTGWTEISEVQVIPGYSYDGSDYTATNLKVGLGFTTSATVSVDVPLEMAFVASVVDADGDVASSPFVLQTYVGNEVLGTPGSDVLMGTPGPDTVVGGEGADLFLPSPGNDTFAGGLGVDTLDFAAAAGAVVADLSSGTATTGLGDTDTVSGIENITGSSFSDVLTGDAGDNVLSGGLGDDVLSGGLGSDTASYAGASSGVSASLLTQGDSTPDVSGGAGMDTLSGFENLTGSESADQLLGDEGANVLSGEGGADLLSGGAGADILRGGAGSDTLYGGPGNDDLSGGEGSDTFGYQAGDEGADLIRDFRLAPISEGGDSIDLSDLLVGEQNTADSLDRLTSFSQDASGRAVITIDANGDGIPDNLQTITLDNVSLLDLQAYAGGESDLAILQKLLDNGNLQTDA